MFFGRKDILDKLSSLQGKSVASLVTCRGRRRIGKSTVIEEFARRSNSRFIKIEGIKPNAGTGNKDELENFCLQLANQTQAEHSTAPDWLAAFTRLDHELDERATVLLLDEISWMGAYEKNFAEYIKVAWDNQWKKHDKLILVLCGSVSGWIRENIVQNPAFYGRRSADLVVRELPLKECVKFWQRKLDRIDMKEVADVIAVTGGVPRYLEEVDPSLSAEENIRQLCLTKDGVLRLDFDEMFNDVITSQPNFVGKVLRSLVGGPQTAEDIAKKLEVSSGGRIKNALIQLEEAGLIRDDSCVNPETQEPMRERRFRLSDNYSRFYLKYVEPNKVEIDNGNFSRVSIAALDNFAGIMGYQFENMVINNLDDLISLLHIDNSLIVSAAPYYRKGSVKERGRKGCQVDLLIQTRRTYYFVEIKHQLEIGPEVINEVDAKIKAMKYPEGVSARAALVYDGQLSPKVAAEGYFDAIIPFRRFME